MSEEYVSVLDRLSCKFGRNDSVYFFSLSADQKYTVFICNSD